MTAIAGDCGATSARFLEGLPGASLAVRGPDSTSIKRGWQSGIFQAVLH